MTYPSSLNLPRTHRCANHPDREGIGICVGCRSVVCVECSTKVDRMNYCIRCLHSTQPAAADALDPARERAVALPLLLLSFLAAAGVFALMGIVLDWVRRMNPGGVTLG